MRPYARKSDTVRGRGSTFRNPEPESPVARGMAFTVPPPRAPLGGGGLRRDRGAARTADPWARWSHWYGTALRWPTLEGPPPGLATGVRFDVLDLPTRAGAALLRRIGPTGPVALGGGRMRLLVAAGSADELPGLLDWLEWGGIELGLTALGEGGVMPAPVPPWWSYGVPDTDAERHAETPAAPDAVPTGTGQGAAVWLRPPEPGREVESTLPALAPFGRVDGNGGSGDAPDLVRLVDAAATECHRARLLDRNTPCSNAQPLAFS